MKSTLLQPNRIHARLEEARNRLRAINRDKVTTGIGQPEEENRLVDEIKVLVGQAESYYCCECHKEHEGRPRVQDTILEKVVLRADGTFQHFRLTEPMYIARCRLDERDEDLLREAFGPEYDIAMGHI